MMQSAQPVASTVTACRICASADLERLLDLPGLPLTGLFCPTPDAAAPAPVDQRLLFCRSCGHGQLESQLDPGYLYGTDYGFRSSISATARSGTQFFVRSLQELTAGRAFESVLDVGCNDLLLLKMLEGSARHRAGIDPVWKNGAPPDAGDIRVIGGTVEETDLTTALAAPPDLIVCRHTIEHIADPVRVVRQLFDATKDDCLFAFEMPGFDNLIARYRFDHVFHQHLQYFSRHSFAELVAACGGTVIGIREHFHDWGAIFVLFRKGRTSAHAFAPPELASIRLRIQAFYEQVGATNSTIAAIDETIVGYGAAQMLPVLNYHLDDALPGRMAVVDDDPEKHGLFYANLPFQIGNPADFTPWSERIVMLTALDTMQPILTRLLAQRPRQLIFPLNVL